MTNLRRMSDSESERARVAPKLSRVMLPSPVSQIVGKARRAFPFVCEPMIALAPLTQWSLLAIVLLGFGALTVLQIGYLVGVTLACALTQPRHS